MKLYQEFKAINNEFPKARILLSEGDDLDTLKKIAFNFALKQNPNIDDTWIFSIDPPMDVITSLDVDDKSELVIRR